jgi:prephenate dehydratase
LPARTGADRTSLAAFLTEDHPGALLEILTEFAVRGINLTTIQSRPTGDRLGQYYFFIDCEGHVDDARVGEALMGLRRVCQDVRFLGSYARCDGGATAIRPGTSRPVSSGTDSSGMALPGGRSRFAGGGSTTVRKKWF